MFECLGLEFSFTNENRYMCGILIMKFMIPFCIDKKGESKWIRKKEEASLRQTEKRKI